MIHTKKGQFYMFAAIILIGSVLFIAANSSNINLNEIENFQSLFDNYLNEAHIVINHAIYSNQEITPVLRNFTLTYIEYSKAQFDNIGIANIYSYDDKLFIVNYLNDPISLKSPEITVNPIQESVIGFQDNLLINYRNETFSFQFIEEEIALKALFVKE